MNRSFIAAVLVFEMATMLATGGPDLDSSDEKPVLKLTWDSPSAIRVLSGSMTVLLNSPTSVTFLRSNPISPNQKFFHFQSNLFRIPNPPVRWHYVVTGEAAYQNLPDLSEIQITACYLGGNVVIDMDPNSGAANSGFMGTSELRRFAIPVQILPEKGDLIELDLSLFIASNEGTPPVPAGGVEKLTLSNFELVRYPDPPVDSPHSSYAARSFFGLDRKSFLIGTATTAILCLAATQTVTAVRRLRKLRADREMRQISSLDG
jgi:hypothetical protein